MTMNKQETAKILSVIKQTYPAFYYRQSEEDHKKTVILWQSLFEEDDAAIVGAALKAFLVADASGYPPTPGQIKEKMRLITNPSRLTEAEAWQAVKKAMRNGIYGAAEEYEQLPEEVKQICSVADLHDWAQMEVEEVNTVVHSNFLKGFRRRQEQQEQIAALPDSVKRLRRALEEQRPALIEQEKAEEGRN